MGGKGRGNSPGKNIGAQRFFSALGREVIRSCEGNDKDTRDEGLPQSSWIRVGEGGLGCKEGRGGELNASRRREEKNQSLSLKENVFSGQRSMLVGWRRKKALG
jgi:hypothetical protein